MSINVDAYDGFCEDPNGNNLKNFDLLDDCRVVGLYTATTTTEIVTSGATSTRYDSRVGTGCFRLQEDGDHTDEWSNYTGLTAIFSDENCDVDTNATITDATYVEGDIAYTEICYSGVSDTEAHKCITDQEFFNVTVTSGGTTEKQTDLNQTCCTDVFNFYWDKENEECKWCSKEDCEPGDIFKIILGSDENKGSFFEQENDEDCYLEVEFDYLFKYKCDELYNCVTGSTANTIDSIFSLDVDVNIEKNVAGKTGYTGNYVTEYTEELYDVSNVVSYLDGNENTGILLEGDNCEKVIENAKDNLGIYCGVIDEDTFYSGWLHHKMTITNEAILSAITNEDIHVSFTINDWICNFYVLTDNIEINKVCQKEDKKTTTITTCPGFDLERVEDNKKSWMANENEVNRYFDFKDRFTDYNVDHHKLVINSKEIDLRFSIPNAVETKVMDYIEDNPCLLEGDLSNIDCCCYCPPGYQEIDGVCVLEESLEIVPCYTQPQVNTIDNGTFDNSLSGWTTPENKWTWSSYTGGSAQYTGYTSGGTIYQSGLTVGNLHQLTFDVCLTAATDTFIDDYGYDFDYTGTTDEGCFRLFQDYDEAWQYAIGDTFTVTCTGDTQVFQGEVTVTDFKPEAVEVGALLCVSGTSSTDGLTDCMRGSEEIYPFYISGNTSDPYSLSLGDGLLEVRNSGSKVQDYNFQTSFGTGCTTTTLEFTAQDPYLTFYVEKEKDHGIFLDNVYIDDCVTYTAETIDGVDDYGNRGAFFFEEATDFDFPLIDTDSNQGRVFEDNNGNILNYKENVENTLWGISTTDTIYGRLNNIGVWTHLQSGTFEPLGQWIGFSYCLEIPETGIYSLAFAVDDFLRVHWNGERIIEIQNNWNDITHSHKGWFVVPIEIEAGKNIIEFEGKNDPNEAQEAAIGAEIYSATPSTLSGLTTESQLSGYTIFSTADRIGELYDLTEVDVSCPDGYALDKCGDTIKCTKIDRSSCVNDNNCVEGCGDQDVDILSKIDRPVTSFTTTDNFREAFYENFIDPRSRQTLNNYPLLRAIYDRYVNSDDYCDNVGGSFDYFKMEDFSKFIGDYWVDIIEQFIPSTTIWGSTFLYGNTIFDNNKFDYRRYSLLTCCDDTTTGKTCPSGYTLSNDGGRCIKTDTVSATTADTVYTVTAATNNPDYSSNGVNFYEEITNRPFPLNDNSSDDIVDNSGNTVSIVHEDQNQWVGKLNEVGVWTTQHSGNDDIPTGEYIGFSYCLEIEEAGVYNVGMGADNECRFYINGDLAVELTDPDSNLSVIKNWFVFPYYFNAGLNIVEMEGLNYSSDAAFGAEIYSADTETLTGVTESQLSAYTIFSTSELVGGVFELGENSGISCPSGYTLNTCSGTPVCTKIKEIDPDIVEISGACKNTNITPLSKVGSKYVDVTQRDVSEILEPDQLAPHTTGSTTLKDHDPLINYSADTTASTITNINIEDSLLNEFYVSGLTNNDINDFLLTATTSASTTIGPYFKRSDDFDYIFTGVSAYLDVIETSSGTTTATTIGVVSGTTTYYSGLTFDSPDCVSVERQDIECPYIYTVNMDVGSEFIGTVNKIPKE